MRPTCNHRWTKTPNALFWLFGDWDLAKAHDLSKNKALVTYWSPSFLERVAILFGRSVRVVVQDEADYIAVDTRVY